MKKIIVLSAFCVCALLSGSSVAHAAKKIQLPAIISDNFDAYMVGALVGQEDWTEYANASAFTVEKISRRNNAVYVSGAGDHVITKEGVSRPDGMQTVYVKTDRRAEWGNVLDGNVQIRLSDAPWGNGTGRFVAVTFKADGNVAFYNKDTDVYENFATYSDEVWTQLDIEWRASDGTARYRVAKGAWTDWMSFPGSDTFSEFNNVGFSFTQPAGAGGVYFDRLD